MYIEFDGIRVYDEPFRRSRTVECVERGRRTRRKVAGPAVHYAFGSTMGALYGIAAELTPKSSAAWGLPFGAALWFGADEVAIPALGLSGQSQSKISTHASALAAHLVYGLTTDCVRRVVRKALR